MSLSKIVFFVFVALVLSGALLATSGFRDNRTIAQEKTGGHGQCVETAASVGEVLSSMSGDDLKQIAQEHPEYLFRVGCTALTDCKGE